MENDARLALLARVARSASGALGALEGTGHGSILCLAAASFGSRPSEDATVPTGFDPLAAALFEAIVEGAYLVASADGVFDDRERRAFERVVVAACGGTVAPQAIGALLGDLADQLHEDGLERRLHMVARTALRKEHAREVLRVAALLAQASEDVSAAERDVLAKLAAACQLDPAEVESALAGAKGALERGSV